MIKHQYHLRLILLFFVSTTHCLLFAQSPAVGKNKHLIFHDIRVDNQGHLLPWYANDPGKSYNFILNAVWTYWKNIPGHWVRTNNNHEVDPSWRTELPFPPKYMLFRTFEDLGVGGDQFAMMLSSFNLLYDYSGNEEVLENMIFQANWYLKYGLSKDSDAWPGIPYPCNTTEAPVYDGDLLLGKGFTQPDKAGSFGTELIMLYKKTGDEKYLAAALKIASTLAMHTKQGDYDHSPLPFKVHAVTGEIKSGYCTNWSGTLELFDALILLGRGDTAMFKKAFLLINEWMMNYPVKNNRWGPFFEDIAAWSDAEINEGSFAWYMLMHPGLYPDWEKQVRHMQNWATDTLGIEYWKQYGLRVMGEQSIYKMQGQSHTSRHASIELLYAAMTGDSSNKKEAVRQLNFCTYAVDEDGKCRWMNFDTYEIWWTDGYGDFIRHFIRSMAASPDLAPSFEDHVLSSTSVLQKVSYAGQIDGTLLEGVKMSDIRRVRIYYKAFDKSGCEKIRLAKKPTAVLIDNRIIKETKNEYGEGYSWKPMATGGLLVVNRVNGNSVLVIQ